MTVLANQYATVALTVQGMPQTLALTSAGSTELTLTSASQVLEFQIMSPGPTGGVGPVGPAGPAGAPGVGVPAGGLTGYLLSKVSGTSYDTAWASPESLGFATQAWVTGQGYLTSSALTGYATQAWVDAQGYLQAGALTGYALLDGSSTIKVSGSGTYAQVLNNGFYATDGYSYTDVGAGGLILHTDGVGDLSLVGGAITFPDSTTQDSAGITATTAAATYAPIAAGVPTGGTAGQALLKVDGTNYNTTWGTPALASHAETTQATVRNSTGSTLTAGQIVYINGALGNRPTVALSKADAESTSAGTYAMVETAIPNNTDGTVITGGTVSGIDTSALSDGDKLYLSPSTAGGWTTTKPSAPNHLVYIGTVTRAHPTLGTIQLRIQNGYELEELHNVAISSPANLDLLAYETSTTLWKNKSIATLGLATQSWVTSQGYLTTAPVTSVAGRTGAITLAVADVSGAAPLASPTLTGTPLSTTAAADTNTTQIATTAFVVGQASASLPIINGTAAIGTSLKYARADHVHATDTTRAPLASPTFTGTPSLPTGTTGVTQTAGDNSTKLATTAFVTTAVSGAGGGGCNVQTFGGAASSGSFTWTKPANAKVVELFLISAGGGGGSGARQATTSGRAGGNGGSAGTFLFARIDAATLGSTETVTVGAGGTGGTAVAADTTNGNAGALGGQTQFSLWRASGGSTQAAGGTTVAGTTTASPIQFLYQGMIPTTGPNTALAGGAGNVSTGQTPTAIALQFYSYGTGGGGGGGAAASFTTSAAGGAGGSKTVSAAPASGPVSSVAGGSAGTTAGVSPTTGVATNGWLGGTGGGGGAYRTGVAGMAGAVGAWPGGGGGGGSASDNGFASGAGGNGANGFAVIITYF